VLPARMFRGEFERRGLAPEVLSRAVEDSGTVTSVLVPWNTCGAYISGVLGVPTAAYFPFCFCNFLSPVLDVLFGFIGFKVPNATPEEPAADEPAPEDVRRQTPVISEGEDHHG
jgi:Na+:H+ antiporter, NhaC family